MLSDFIGILLCAIPSAHSCILTLGYATRLLTMAAAVASNDWKASCVLCGELMCQKDTYAKSCKATVLKCEKVNPTLQKNPNPNQRTRTTSS